MMSDNPAFDNPAFDNPAFDNPAFDNALTRKPTRREAIRAHLPIVLAVGGAGAIFLSLHIAAYAVAFLGALHLVVGLVVIAFTALRARRNKTS